MPLAVVVVVGDEGRERVDFWGETRFLTETEFLRWRASGFDEREQPIRK